MPPDQIGQHVQKLDELVGDCLSTSRNLTQELSPPVLHCGTLGETVEWLGLWFGDKHGLTVAVEVIGELAPAPEPLRVLLFQTVRELLFNVVKHSGKMEARVGLSSQDGFLAIQVEDDGEGFDPEVVQRSLKKPEGFGLFNIRERLESLGGRLETESTPHGGACFRVVVPVAEISEAMLEDTVPERVKMVAPRVRKSRAEGGVVQLLVVDDHAVVREGFVGLLNRQPDFRVIGEAADGEEAIRQAEALQPNAIVMDVDMPNLNGIEATRRIKLRHPEIVIVGLSLHEEEGVSRPSSRPVLMPTLANTIRRKISSKPSAEPAVRRSGVDFLTGRNPRVRLAASCRRRLARPDRHRPPPPTSCRALRFRHARHFRQCRQNNSVPSDVEACESGVDKSFINEVQSFPPIDGSESPAPASGP